MNAPVPSRSSRCRAASRFIIGPLALAGLGSVACDGKNLNRAQTPTAASEPTHEITQTRTDGPVRLTLTADRDRARGGDPVRLTLRVESEQGVAVGIPKVEGLLGDFEVRKTEKHTTPCDPFMNCAEWEYTLDCVMPGVATVPPLAVEYTDPRERADGSKGTTNERVTTDPIDITIEAALADLKGPLAFRLPFEWRLLWWGLGTVGVVGLLAWLMRRSRRAESHLRTAAIAPPEAAHLWALRELARLEQERLIDRGLLQEYVFRVNLLLRQYIERRFEFMAGEQTSEEFVLAVGDLDVLNAPQKETLLRFVSSCDPVKYAKHAPEKSEIVWIGACAREFVLETAETRSSASEPRTPMAGSMRNRGGTA